MTSTNEEEEDPLAKYKSIRVCLYEIAKSDRQKLTQCLQKEFHKHNWTCPDLWMQPLFFYHGVDANDTGTSPDDIAVDAMRASQEGLPFTNTSMAVSILWHDRPTMEPCHHEDCVREDCEIFTPSTDVVSRNRVVYSRYSLN
jgi:hypothetical protein